MTDYKILQQAQAMFAQNNCIGADNCIFVAAKDTQSQGMQAGLRGTMGLAGKAIAGGMASADALYHLAYDGLLLNLTERGLGIIPLLNQGFNLNGDLAKMTAVAENFLFIDMNAIEEINVKDYSFLNRKVKTVRFFLKNGQKIQVLAKVAEKMIPYQEANFARFMAKYM